MNPASSTPNGLPATLSPSPGQPSTSNGPLSSPGSSSTTSPVLPRPGGATQASSPLIARPANAGQASSPLVARPANLAQSSPSLARSSQPEQIIVPVGNMMNPNKSSSSDGQSSSSRQSSSSSSGGVAALSQPSVVAAGGATPMDNRGVLERSRLRELVKEVDPLEQMDDDVEDILLQVADDFIENVVSSSCQLAKHRRSNTLEAKDVQLYLERSWNMQIPGFGSEEIRPFKKSVTTEAHKQRMALIRKTLKKY